MTKTLNPANFPILPSPHKPEEIPIDGLLYPLPDLCHQVFSEKCRGHYRSLQAGYTQCPFGLASYKSQIEEDRSLIFTGIKIIGHCDREALQRKESTKGLKFFTPAEILQIASQNQELAKTLDSIFDGKIQRQKTGLEDATRLANSAFHEIRPLNAEIKAASIRLRSLIGQIPITEMNQELGSRVSDQIRNIESAANLITFRMEQRDFLTNPSLLDQSPFEKFSLKREIDKIYKLYRTTLKKGATHMSFNMNDRIQVRTKPMFCLALYVLTENAIKYSPTNTEQEIVISDDVINGFYKVTFSSVGPKIESDEVEKIFGAFNRGRHALEEGTGVGLFLARRLCNTLGMNLVLDQQIDPLFSFESRAYHQTDFTIEIPTSMAIIN